MDRKRVLLVTLVPVLLLVLTVGLLHAQGPGPQVEPAGRGEGLLQAPLGSGFTYQGQLKDSGGNPIDSTCSFTFSLWDAVSGGTQVGSDSVVAGVAVVGGYFAALVNGGGEFGAGAFAGEARWLEIAVQCTGDPGPTPLSPRQPLNAAPYASYSQVAPWAGLSNVPAGFADNVDNDVLAALTPTLGQVAKWDGSAWAAAGDDDTTYSAGVGLVLTDTVMSVDFTVVAPLTHTHTYTSTDVLKYFAEEALIPTNGAFDWEAFTIDGDVYLAVANRYNGSTYNLDSKIYRWTGTSFTETQSIPTHAAMDWEFFTIGSDHYLAVANHYNGSSYNLDSKIYRWTGTSFTETQSIPTNGASDWEFFTIDSDYYLAVANYHNGSSHNLNSRIYRWTGTSFAQFQAIPTNGAQSWKFFTIGSDHYLAVANSHNDATHDIDSRLYWWNGASFAELQSIPTHAAMDWEFFTIGSDHYLAVANSQSMGLYNLDSRIYRWTGASFAQFQSIPTSGAQDWEVFTIGGDVYLAVANCTDGSTHNLNSWIYRWHGTGFVTFQSIPTSCATNWAFSTIGSDPFLAVANYYNGSSYSIDSKIYRGVLESRAGTSYLWGQNGPDIYYDLGNVGVGTTSPQSALQVEGYLQMDTLTTAPPAADCDEMSERGRMKVDVANNVLYICTDSGWASWAASGP